MTVVLQNVTHSCFGLSYLLALLLEMARLRWPLPWLRPLTLVLGGIGFLTHSLFLAYRHPTPAMAYGALLGVAWVLAIFHIYGSIHRSRLAWGIFVLPMILGLVILAFLLAPEERNATALPVGGVQGYRFWGAVHGFLILFAAVGVSVGSIASMMYLIQTHRLRKKLNPLGGVKLLSLERLETMNRRAVNIAFPLLTLGLLLGAGLLQRTPAPTEDWLSPKVLGTAGLWLVCALLFYLRYAAHVPGRRLANFTLLAFVLLLLVLTAAHPVIDREPLTANLEDPS